MHLLHVPKSCCCIPPPHQVTTGSGPPMALLSMGTVTSTGSVVVMDQVGGLVWPSSICKTPTMSVPATGPPSLPP